MSTAVDILLWGLLSIGVLIILTIWVTILAVVWSVVTSFTKTYKDSAAKLAAEEQQKEYEDNRPSDYLNP